MKGSIILTYGGVLWCKPHTTRSEQPQRNYDDASLAD